MTSCLVRPDNGFSTSWRVVRWVFFFQHESSFRSFLVSLPPGRWLLCLSLCLSLKDTRLRCFFWWFVMTWPRMRDVPLLYFSVRNHFLVGARENCRRSTTTTTTAADATKRLGNSTSVFCFRVFFLPSSSDWTLDSSLNFQCGYWVFPFKKCSLWSSCFYCPTNVESVWCRQSFYRFLPTNSTTKDWPLDDVVEDVTGVDAASKEPERGRRNWSGLTWLFLFLFWKKKPTFFFGRCLRCGRPRASPVRRSTSSSICDVFWLPWFSFSQRTDELVGNEKTKHEKEMPTILEGFETTTR